MVSLQGRATPGGPGRSPRVRLGASVNSLDLLEVVVPQGIQQDGVGVDGAESSGPSDGTGTPTVWVPG
jgi:hypothetical protein